MANDVRSRVYRQETQYMPAKFLWFHNVIPSLELDKTKTKDSIHAQRGEIGVRG